MKNKIIVLGWDGASLNVITPLISLGKLPFIKKIVENGSYGILKSTIPTNSAPAWSSFFTGMNPGKHGIYFFTGRVEGSYRFQFTHSITRTKKPLWMITNDSEHKVGVMNVPCTFPPDMVNGFMISGFDTPSTNCSYTWPEGLEQELKKNVDEYIIEAEEARIVGFNNDKERLRFVNALLHTIESRWKCAKYLFEKYLPDLFILVFTETDRIQHRFWKYMDKSHPHYQKKEAEPFEDAIFKIYMNLDKKLGEILEKIDDHTTLFIISDHGMGMRSVKTIYLNRWLLSKGYLNINTGEKVSDRLRSIGIRIVKGTLNRIKRGMSINQRRIARLFFHKIMLKGAMLLEMKNIDWEHTKVYSHELMNAIWINLKGREPLGTVQPGEEYERLCDEIIRELKSINDPETGEPIVQNVYKRDEIYHGSEIGKAPDLVVEWNNYNPQVSPLLSLKEADQYLSRLTPKETSRAAMSQNSGDHKPDGILFAYGQGIKKGHHLKNEANIIDIAPTILYIMGEKIPVEMDGRILEEIFLEDFLHSNKTEYTSSDKQDNYNPRQVDISPDDEEKLKERLKSLGYI